MMLLFIGRMVRLSLLYKTEIRMKEIESILNYIFYSEDNMDFLDRESLAQDFFKFVKESEA